MEEKNTYEDLTVGNYHFTTKEDAELAALEERKTTYLHTHMDYTNPQTVLKVYQKAIEDRFFKTPVGFDFLAGLRKFLVQKLPGKDIPAIPMYVKYTQKLRAQTKPARERVIREEQKQKRMDRFHMSLLCNIALVILVIAMFAITVSSPSPNILNYEKAIVNKYAAWEEELTEREDEVREKERALDLDIEQ
ncbi:MAG: hypothetical protein PHP50_12795 [Lachnospiraceae bacterium]|nr:hypothetical protein [Lachnospiraceae bacterium]